MCHFHLCEAFLYYFGEIPTGIVACAETGNARRDTIALRSSPICLLHLKMILFRESEREFQFSL